MCGDAEPSVHATLALATSDWSVSRVAADVIKHALDGEVRFRRALSDDVDVGGIAAVVAAALTAQVLRASLADRIKAQCAMEVLLTTATTTY